MIHAYVIEGNRVAHLAPPDPACLQEALWIDLVAPTPEEREHVDTLHREALPEPEEVDEIEATSRAYEDESGLHLHTFFLVERDGKTRLETVAFTLTDGRLITLRDAELPAFRLLRRRLLRMDPARIDPTALLLEVVEIALDRLADHIEAGYAHLDEVGKMVLATSERRPEQAIDRLAQVEDTNGKIRLCLLDLQRVLTFLTRRLHHDQAQRGRIHDLLRDIESLLPHNGYLFDKINFLMDAALGFINVEQNQIIKIFSIAAVVFLPPTLVASVYGMNFRHMPELDWPWGYPLALALMVATGIAPYWYFKRKGWL